MSVKKKVKSRKRFSHDELISKTKYGKRIKGNIIESHGDGKEHTVEVPMG